MDVVIKKFLQLMDINLMHSLKKMCPTLGYMNNKARKTIDDKNPPPLRGGRDEKNLNSKLVKPA